jgi:hypothetical protein
MIEKDSNVTKTGGGKLLTKHQRIVGPGQHPSYPGSPAFPPRTGGRSRRNRCPNSDKISSRTALSRPLNNFLDRTNSFRKN